MARKIIILTGILLMIVFGLSGCFGGGSDDSRGAGGGAGAGSEGPILADAQGDPVPEDVPVMPGAYNLDVIRGSSQLNFTINGDVQTVVDWYAAELENLGWSKTRSPDSAIGAMGSMTRVNEAGDKLSINLSYNQVSGAVTVAIAISRIR